uniref:ribose-phosphate diphosphokinase n=2 Tax=Lygus hesperus TaxID=30085 RepID=A0A0A9WHD3_LYGHE
MDDPVNRMDSPVDSMDSPVNRMDSTADEAEEVDEERDTDVQVMDATDTRERVYISPARDADICIFSGTVTAPLASEVCAKLGVQLGRARIGTNIRGETQVEILDSVRGKECYVIQSLCGPKIHDQVMELLLMVSTLRRASVFKITVVVPYLSYARQLQSCGKVYSFAAADLATMMESVGVDAVIAVDLFRTQVAGFFHNTPVVNVDAIKAVVPYFANSNKLPSGCVSLVTSTNSSTRRVIKFQRELLHYGILSNVAFSYAVNDDGRTVCSNEHHHEQFTYSTDIDILGSVQGKDVIIVQDMVDSASHISTVSVSLRAAGAKRIFVYAPHGLFTGDAMHRISISPIDEVVVLNTVPLPLQRQSHKVRQLSIAGLVAETIHRIHHDLHTVDITYR